MFSFNAPQVPQVSAKDLFEAIEKKEDFIILDVRTPGEYEKGKIQNSINLPVDQIQEKIETIIPEKDKKTYVYCLSGSRSVFAVSQMIALGYKNVFDLQNGLLSWRISKYPLST